MMRFKHVCDQCGLSVEQETSVLPKGWFFVTFLVTNNEREVVAGSEQNKDAREVCPGCVVPMAQDALNRVLQNASAISSDREFQGHMRSYARIEIRRDL